MIQSDQYTLDQNKNFREFGDFKSNFSAAKIGLRAKKLPKGTTLFKLYP